MNADAIKAAYAANLHETVVVRRFSGAGPLRSRFDVSARARVLPDSEARKLVADLKVAELVVILLVDDLILCGLTLPLLDGDKVVVKGAELGQAMHECRTAPDGTPVAYVLRVGG
jgi:hypothetical protein